MNVGQILETHSAGRGGSRQEDGRHAGRRPRGLDGADKKQLKEIYGDKAYKAEIATSRGQTIELARNLSKGVPFASPVFERCA